MVGSGITAGLYRSLNPVDGSCYWERLSGFGGTIDEIIANDLGGGPRIVAIAASDKGFNSDRCGTWTEVVGAITPSPTADFGDGEYLVGTEIAPGTWQSTGPSTDSCYWARLSGFGGTFAELIANDIGPNPRVVAIAATDVGFLSNRCGTWKKM